MGPGYQSGVGGYGATVEGTELRDRLIDALFHRIRISKIVSRVQIVPITLDEEAAMHISAENLMVLPGEPEEDADAPSNLEEVTHSLSSVPFPTPLSVL